jgi:uracil-DNA glycosylase family 4
MTQRLGIPEKPPECARCPLEHKGFGFTRPTGPVAAPVLLIGESAGRWEGIKGEPFVGDAGAMLDRVMRHASLDRADFRIDNLLRCQPPGDWLDGAPWEKDAIAQCERHHLGATLLEKHQVVVPLGSMATRRLLGLPKKRFKIQDFHGTVTRDPMDRFWIVPTFHPSFLQRGATKLIKTSSVDLEHAVEVAGKGFKRSHMNLVCDPDPAWFAAWAKLYTDACQLGHDVDLAVDIETPETGNLEEDNRQEISWHIIRVNFAYNGEEGITVPFTGPYMTTIQNLLATDKPKLYWNAKCDVPRLCAAGLTINGKCFDYMWAWHVLQSDLPRGLGFVAPFYSDGPPWKHLADTAPVEYAAMDGIQTWRIGYGVTKDLVDCGMWHIFADHVHEFHEIVLDPAEEIGLHLDGEKLEEFRVDLIAKLDEINSAIQTHIPWCLLPLEKKEGLTKLTKKHEEEPWGLFAEKVLRVVKVCLTCNAEQVTKTHRCKNAKGKVDKSRTPKLELVEREVVRYFRKKPFNPNSPQQIMAYIKHKGDKPGKAKKTLKDSTDKETLKKLGKKNKFYLLVLDYRKVSKVKGTYVDGMIKHMDDNDRVHPTFTPKPSTFRLASENPNTTNLIDDKEDNPAAGFRKCVTASPGHKIIEADYAGIEAVIVGRCSGEYWVSLRTWPSPTTTSPPTSPRSKTANPSPTTGPSVVSTRVLTVKLTSVCN